MASQFHTPSLFDDVIFLGENMPDDSQQHQEQYSTQQQEQQEGQQTATIHHHQQHSQRIRGMDQGYTDYSNNADEPYNTMEHQQQQLLTQHHLSNPHHIQQESSQLHQQHEHHHQQLQQHMSMPNNVALMENNQTMLATSAAIGGLQTLAARKQMAPASVTTVATAIHNSGDASKTKPLSPYALFFRDTVSTIKQQNPNGSFQELSRIVASMWDVLDQVTKDLYAKKHEAALMEYFKSQTHINNNEQQQQQLQHFETTSTQYGGENLIGSGGVGGGPINALQTKPAVFTISRYNTEMGTAQVSSTTSPAASSASSSPSPMMANTNLHNNMAHQLHQQQQQQQQESVHSTQIGMDSSSPNDCYNVNSLMMSDMMPQQHALLRPHDDVAQPQQDHVWIQDSKQNILINTSNARSDGIVSTEQMLTEAGSVQKCTRESCTQMAIINPDWEDEYCSNECVVLHCRNVFNTWIKANADEKKRKEAKN